MKLNVTHTLNTASPALRVEHDLSDRLAVLLETIFCGDEPTGHFARLEFHDSGFSIEGEITDMNVVLETEQRVTATVAFTNRRGGAARVESTTWTSSDEAIATVTADPANPLTAEIRSVAIGDAIVTCSADADLDAGETRTLEVVGTVLVREAEAQVGEMQFGTPEDVTAEVPPPVETPTPEEPPTELMP